MSVKAGTWEATAAKQAIREVVCRYSRAVDRFDMELLVSCWHPGGTDCRPPLFDGTAKEFAAWLKPTLSRSQQTTHRVINTIINLQGSQAGVETYWEAVLRMEHEGKLYDIVRGGRYLDRFECINEVWAIRARRSVTDFSRVEFVDPALVNILLSGAIPPSVGDARPDQPARDRSDPSYEVLGDLLAV